MDPLSITASVTALAQFVFGILTVLQSVKEGHRQRLKLLNEINALWKDLTNLEVLIDLNSEGENNCGLAVLSALEEPTGVFPQLRNALGDLESKLEPKTGIAKLRQNLKWPFTQPDVDRTVQQIYRYRQQLNDVLQQANFGLGKEIYNDVAVVKNIVIDHEYKAIVDWLSPLDFIERQRAILKGTVADAGRWLLESNGYQAWEAGREPVLWCVGIPGAGKTVLASIVSNKLLELRNPLPSNQAAVLMIYFSVDDQHSQSLEFIIGSLLKQLLQWRSDVPEELRQLYHSRQTSNTLSSKEVLNKLLTAQLSQFDTVHVVIDGLDELIVEEQRSCIMEYLFNSKEGISLLITSRPVERICQLFDTSSHILICDDCNASLRAYFRVNDRGCSSNICQACYHKKSVSEPTNNEYITNNMRFASSKIQISANFQDITTYVKWRIDSSNSLRKLSLKRPSLREYILSEILRKLKESMAHSLHAVTKTLQSLSTGMNELYESAMKRINDGDYREEAINFLRWVVCATRPLSMLEVEHAAATTPGDRCFQSDKIVDAEDVVSNCAGLVVLDESGHLRLVHKTAIEYFYEIRAKWFPEGHHHLGLVCLTYLLFDDFDSRPILAGEWNADFDNRHKEYYLLDYASTQWACHAAQVPQGAAVNLLVSTFLKSEAHARNSVQAIYYTEDWSLRTWDAAYKLLRR